MNTSMCKFGLLCTTALAICVKASLAAAQTASPVSGANANSTLNEIVVTAQKRAENVQEVPIAVTVVSADQLARRGVQDIQDLSQASASLEFTAPSAAPGGGAFVRGIGTNQVGNATAESSVSVVLDGVVLGNANINDIFDIERVEVLKGPQGTLFGSSVSAGVLNITTKAPVLDKFSGYISTEFGIRGMGSEYSRDAVRGALNVPVTQNSALRIAGYYYDNSGLTHDVSLDRNSDTANYGFRGRYLAHFDDRITFNLIGDYNHSSTNYGGGFLWRAATPGSLLAQALQSCGLQVGPNNTDNCAGFNDQFKSDIGGVSGQFDVDLRGATLTSITSYRRVSSDTVADVVALNPTIARQFLQNCDFVDCSPVVSLTSGADGNPERLKRSLMTQEIRLASDANRHLEWVGGVYYQNATYYDRQPSQLVLHPAVVGTDLVLGSGTANTHARAEDYAAFGNATLYVQPSTRLIAGARYTHSGVSENKADPINAGNDDTFFGRTSANAVT